MPPADGARTVAELGRTVDAFREEFREDRREMREFLASVIVRDVYDADNRTRDKEVNALREQIVGLAGSHQWLARLCGGALGTSVIGGAAMLLIHR